jgi:hypothetical protein
MKYLNDVAWKTPENYAGFNPVGDYLVMALCVNNGDILSESNYACAKRDLLKVVEKYPFDGEEDFRPSAWVYEWSAKHWAAGTLNYLMVRADAPSEFLVWVDDQLEQMDGYPVWSEDDLSERETTEAERVWREMTREARKHLLKECGYKGTMRAACRSYPPSDDDGSIQNRLLGY